MMRRLSILLALALPATVAWAQTGAPTEAQGAAALGEAQRQAAAGDLPAAETTLRHLLAAHPEKAEGEFLLGTVLFRMNRPTESLAAFTAGARHANPGTEDLITIASDYILLKDLVDAEHWLQYAVGQNAGSSEAWYLLGRTQYNLDRSDMAVTSFRRALELRPQDSKAEYNLGLAEQKLHHLPEAEALFRQAIAWEAVKPTPDPQPWLDLGLLLLEEDHVQEALEPLQKAASLGPQNPFIQQQEGVCLQKLGRYDEATAALMRAVALAPEASQPHYFLGRIDRQLGKTAEADHEFLELKRLVGHQSSSETPNADVRPGSPVSVRLSPVVTQN